MLNKNIVGRIKKPATRGRSERTLHMANGAKVFAVAALMALVAIGASQGQAEPTEIGSLPALGAAEF